MKAKFKVESITVDKLLEQYKNKEIVIPQIQRNLAWKKEDKEALQASIAKGYPFGLITFAYLNQDKKQKYIIDGLQRTTTIMSIYTDIFKYQNENELEEMIHSAALERKIAPSLSEDELWSFTHEFKKHLKKINLSSTHLTNGVEVGKHVLETWKEYVEEHNLCYEIQENSIMVLAMVVYTNLQEKLAFNDYQIPCVEFFGTEESISDLFVLINQSGKKLNKSDILKSKWSQIKMHFKDKEISNNMKDRYISIDGDFSIEYEKINHLSPYDVIYYIFFKVMSNAGEFLKNIFIEKNFLANFDSLIFLIKYYLERKDKTEEELKGNIKNSRTKAKKIDEDFELGNEIKENIDSIKVVNDIIANFSITCKIFEEIFGSLINFKSNKKTKTNFSKDLIPSSQIVAILGNIYSKIHNNSNFVQKDFVKHYSKKILNRYLLDKLEKMFGAGSSMKAFKSMKEQLYLDESAKVLESKIQQIYMDQIEEKKIKFEKTTTKTIMDYIYRNIISVGQNFEDLLEDDHLVPKAKLNNYKGVSCFANYSLLNADKNNEKRDSLEKENIEHDAIYKILKLKNEKSADELKEKFEKLCQELNQESYYEFLECRKNIIIDMIVRQ